MTKERCLSFMGRIVDHRGYVPYGKCDSSPVEMVIDKSEFKVNAILFAQADKGNMRAYAYAVIKNHHDEVVFRVNTKPSLLDDILPLGPTQTYPAKGKEWSCAEEKLEKVEENSTENPKIGEKWG